MNASAQRHLSRAIPFEKEHAEQRSDARISPTGSPRAIPPRETVRHMTLPAMASAVQTPARPFP